MDFYERIKGALAKAPAAWVCDVLSVDDLARLERRGIELFDRDYDPEFDTYKSAAAVLEQIINDDENKSWSCD